MTTVPTSVPPNMPTSMPTGSPTIPFAPVGPATPGPASTPGDLPGALPPLSAPGTALQTSLSQALTTLAPTLATTLAPAIATTAFSTALAVWVTWFVTHLPWLKMPEPMALSTILGVWILAATWSALGAPAGARWRVGILSGIAAAVIGLLILGSKLTQVPADAAASGDAVAAAVRPSAALMALGFVTLGGIVGAIGTGLASLLPRPHAVTEVSALDWTAHFAVVAAVAMTPLLFIGGLVTSTNSGMAVPDWPNTYGSNMFLFPLGPRAAADVYLEHTHRLFGSLIGLTSLTLLALVLRYETRRWVKFWASAVFVLVCLQGLLGGIRVIFGSDVISEDNRVLSMLHGIKAQAVFAAAVALAVFLTQTFRNATFTPASALSAAQQRSQKILRILATAVLHTTFIQLALGATWRHLRVTHALWTHVALAFLIFFAALLAGMLARSTPEPREGLAKAIRLCGIAVLVAVSVQFALGWVALIVGGVTPSTEDLTQALIFTSHQANGAVFIAAITALAVWTKKAARIA